MPPPSSPRRRDRRRKDSRRGSRPRRPSRADARDLPGCRARDGRGSRGRTGKTPRAADSWRRGCPCRARRRRRSPHRPSRRPPPRPRRSPRGSATPCRARGSGGGSALAKNERRASEQSSIREEFRPAARRKFRVSNEYPLPSGKGGATADTHGGSRLARRHNAIARARWALNPAARPLRPLPARVSRARPARTPRPTTVRGSASRNPLFGHRRDPPRSSPCRHPRSPRVKTPSTRRSCASCKLDGNRQCMTCQGHGGRAPQYACTTFGTFVCTTCSGVHREFQFRVKSISNSHFTPEEVKTMQDAGNDAARARYLAGWYGTPHERSCPLVENTKREPLKTSSGRCSTRGGSKATPRPRPSQAQAQAQAQAHAAPGIQTELSVTPHRRCRPCERRRLPRARAALLRLGGPRCRPGAGATPPTRDGRRSTRSTAPRCRRFRRRRRCRRRLAAHGDLFGGRRLRSSGCRSAGCRSAPLPPAPLPLRRLRARSRPRRPGMGRFRVRGACSSSRTFGDRRWVGCFGIGAPAPARAPAPLRRPPRPLPRRRIRSARRRRCRVPPRRPPRRFPRRPRRPPLPRPRQRNPRCDR